MNARSSPAVVAASIGSGVRWTTRSASGHEASIRENLPRCSYALNGWTDSQRVTLRIDVQVGN
jgi:plastocyanin